jgi:hypothetical protein
MAVEKKVVILTITAPAKKVDLYNKDDNVQG